MIDKVNQCLNHATMDDYEQIMDVFKLHKAYFPHIRGDKIRRMIAGVVNTSAHNFTRTLQ